LLLLDEPSVGVDPVSRREIWQLAMDLSGPETSLVWTTNILEDAAKCDEVLLLHEGQVRYAGAPAGLAAEAKGRCFARPLGAGVPRHVLQEQLLDAGIVAGRIEGADLPQCLMMANRSLPALWPKPSQIGAASPINLQLLQSG
jgi:ABC-2 type transport system ATP-binding protein